MTESVKRGRGRPRKVVEPKNPDCEPATKGYVKCVARKIYRIAPKQYCYSGVFWGFISILIGSVFAVITQTPQSEHMMSILVFAAISTALLALHDFVLYLAYSNDEARDLSFAQKYEPLTCERKEECE